MFRDTLFLSFLVTAAAYPVVTALRTRNGRHILWLSTIWFGLCFTVLKVLVVKGPLPTVEVIAFALVPVLSVFAFIAFIVNPWTRFLPKLIWIYYLLDVVSFGSTHAQFFPDTGHAWLDVALIVLALDIGWQAIALSFDFYSSRRRTEADFKLGSWLVKSFLTLAVMLVFDLGQLALILVIQQTMHYWWLFAAAVLGLGEILLNYAWVRFFHFWIEDVKVIDDIPPTLLQLLEKSGKKSARLVEYKAGHSCGYSSGWCHSMGNRMIIGYREGYIKESPIDHAEYVLAHELGHAHFQDTLGSIVLRALITVIVFLVYDLTVRSYFGPGSLPELGNPRNLPALLLALHLGRWLLGWIELAYSRWYEARADWYALNLTGNPQAMRAFNQPSDSQPCRKVGPVECLFLVHPPALERIAMSDRWEQLHSCHAT